jgi:iron complex outermembrane receptor protein
VVVRGFNSSFSGSLHTLTDNRIAGMPSLRVNLMAFMPQTNDDIERVEVVLGPGAALYGPNTANGVLHVITKSPIDHPGSTVSITSGERDVLHFTGRSAVRLSDRFGFKISGQYFQGDEWRSTDPKEDAARRQADDDFDAWKQKQPLGLSEAELHQRADRIGARDFGVSRYSLDTRADWRLTANLSAVLTAGLTNVGKAIEMSGVGAGMFNDWMYTYYQARLSYGRWFAQGT